LPEEKTLYQRTSTVLLLSSTSEPDHLPDPVCCFWATKAEQVRQ